MNPSQLITGEVYDYVTPTGTIDVEYYNPNGSWFVFKDGSGFIHLPPTHVERYVYPKGVMNQPKTDTELETAGRSAFHAFHRVRGFKKDDGSFLPAWPDLSQQERAAWRAAAMDAHNIFMIGKSMGLRV